MRIEYEENVSSKLEFVIIDGNDMVKVPKEKGSHSHEVICNGNYCFKNKDGSMTITCLSIGGGRNYTYLREYKHVMPSLETTTHIFVSKTQHPIE